MNKKLNRKMLFLSVLSTLFTGCAHGFDQTVPYVDRDRYMGPWYVIAGRFTMFEKDVYNSLEKYTWNAEKQQIDIDFTYRQGGFDGKLKQMPQTGWIDNAQTNATWKISPFWPLKFTYLIIALDPNYEWTVVGVPSQSYVWIMARDPKFTKEKVDEILKYLDSIHYSISDIVYVPHNETQ